MKPFDLEKYLAGAKVITRAGYQVKQLTYFPDIKNDNIVLFGVIEGSLESFSKDGVFLRDGEPTGFDLFIDENQEINNE